MPDKLSGEGETKLVERTRVRRECENCGKPAFYRNTYLNDGSVGARRNPASKAYRRDDCTFSSDHDQYLCGDCHQDAHKVGVPDGYDWCATFQADRFPQMFLTWTEREVDAEAIKQKRDAYQDAALDAFHDYSRSEENCDWTTVQKMADAAVVAAVPEIAGLLELAAPNDA